MFQLNRVARFIALAAAACFSISAAAAQVPQFIGKCGATFESNITTNRAPSAISSTSFVQVAKMSFSILVAAPSDCVVVRFTGATSCRGAGNNDRCFVRALHNGVPMAPDGEGHQTIDSESQLFSAHGFEWAFRGLTLGPHNITIEAKVNGPGTTLLLDDWLLNVQLLS